MFTIAAEDILPGHPDRLCDAVAERLVNTGLAFDEDALVGVEVALHRRFLAITGRIAAGLIDDIELSDRGPLLLGVQGIFESAGYTGRWAHPVEVVTDLDIGPLAEDERSIRCFSDDQGIAVGFADPAQPFGVPIEATTARRLREALVGARGQHADQLGPDGKVLVTIEPGARPRLVAVNVAIQHTADVGFADLHRMVVPHLELALTELEQHLDIPVIDGTTLRLNGIGDFTCGGPFGDNGLSGKKLVVDHYGPQVPIGGGAICGKDPHKPDRVGPLRARQLAVRLGEVTGQAATVHLGWLPGLESPDRVGARLADGTLLDRRQIERLVTVPDLSLAGSATELELCSVDWVSTMRTGYFGSDWVWER